ncbi:MAG: hypothetical protein EPO03_11870 [Porticoccaceae bacterium]|nr:MAG: hypothetical protein EPO03_11870 [Porticoccaceae bacterium]
MTGPEMLREFEDNWVTAMGAWFPEGRVVLRGKDVLSDLGRRSWMEYFIYGINGEELPRFARFVEGVWALTTSYPDPRLWNNRVAALAGASRSTAVLALSAGVAVSEASVYGLRPIKGALDFLYRADKKLDDGLSLEEIIWQELKKYRNVFGYGRPITAADERVAPLMDFARSLGMGDGKFIKLAFAVEDYLKSSRLKYQINIAGVVAGLVADEGRTPDDHYHMAALSFVAGMMPCYIDARQKREGAFFPLRTSRIHYSGAEARRWGEE